MKENNIVTQIGPYTIPGTDIVDVVAGIVNIAKRDMKSKSRERGLADKRNLAMFLLCERTNMTHARIGAAFNRDRTTVIHARKTIVDLTFGDKEFKQYVDGLLATTPDLKTRNDET